MSYRLHRVPIPLGPPGAGSNVGTIVNQFLDINQFTSVMAMTLSYKEGRRRANTGYLNILLRQGGARHYGIVFTGPTLQQASDNARLFFFVNDTFISVASVVLQPPSAAPNQGSLLVIYTAMRDLIRSTRPGMYPGYAPTGGALAAGSWGTFRNVFDPIFPQVTALNLGNVAWPQGRPGLLFRTVKGCPDGADSYLAGVAPCCGVSGALAASPATLFVDCGCIPGLPGPDYLQFANTPAPPPSSTTPPVILPPGPSVPMPTVTGPAPVPPPPPPSTSTLPTTSDCPYGQPTYVVVLTGTIHGCNYPASAIRYERLPDVPLTNVAYNIGPRNAAGCALCYSHFRSVSGYVVDSGCDYDELCANAQVSVDPASAGPGGACTWSTADDGVRMSIVNTVTGEVVNTAVVLPGTTGGFDCNNPQQLPRSVFFAGLATNQRLRLSTGITIPAGTTNTVMIWARGLPGGTDQMGLYGDDGTTDFLQWLDVSPPHRWRLRANSADRGLGAANVLENTWYQIFIRTRGLAGWAIFQNGNNLVGSSSGATADFTINNVGVRGGSRYWSGQLTQMARWNRDLTGAERTALYGGGIPVNAQAVVPSGLLNYWPMGTGDTFPIIQDLVGGNNMTMQNMTAANFDTEYPGP